MLELHQLQHSQLGLRLNPMSQKLDELEKQVYQALLTKSSSIHSSTLCGKDEIDQTMTDSLFDSDRKNDEPEVIVHADGCDKLGEANTE